MGDFNCGNATGRKTLHLAGSLLAGSLLAGLLLAAWTLCATPALAQTSAEIFEKTCKACHTIGGGKLVGPDLKGVTERRDMDWIVRFVQSSQAMVKAGDKTAVELFAEFKVPMPDQPLSEAQVKGLMDFIKTGKSVATPAAPASAEQVARGERLFQGKQPLANGGPPCSSCHDVTNDAIISGGVLARELTTVFTRLGGVGVRAVLGSPPFPVMQRAYDNKALTDDEVTSLVGFLKHANAQQKNHMPRDTGIKLAASGAVGTLLLLGLYSLLWRRRKRGSVNQEIYDRQVKSS